MFRPKISRPRDPLTQTDGLHVNRPIVPWEPFAFLLFALTTGTLFVSGCGDSVESPEAEGSAAVPSQLRAALTDLEDGLELHWTFEDRSGSQITDVSGNGRHGTLQSGSFVSSPWGDAVDLDGVDDYISLTGPRDPAIYGGVNGDFTISARVRVDDVDKLNTLCFGCGPFATMYVGTPAYGPEVLSSVYDQDTLGVTWVESTNALEDDTWVNITMIVEGGVGTRYYLDCEWDSTIPDEDVGLKNYSYSSVGEGSASDRWFGGEIDDLRIWNRALSANELLLVCTDTAEPLCSGAPEGPSLVDPPNPPSSYDAPDEEDEEHDVNPAVIEDAADLEAALDDGYLTLILEDGFYDHGDLNGDYLEIQGLHLWARNAGQAVLNFGIDAGGNSGGYASPEIHGLVFDIDDVDHAADPTGGSTSDSAAFYTWGAAHEAVVEDCTFNGNHVIPRAISMTAYDGMSVARVRVEDFTRFGILALDTNDSPISTEMSITDVWMRNIADPDCWGVEQSTCGYYPGTQENGLFIGDQAIIDRVFIRDVRSAGIGLGHETRASNLSNLDIDRIGVGQSTIGVGVYFEAISRTTTVEDFCIGPLTRTGVNSEWDQCPNGNTVGPRGIDNIVQNGLIQANQFGVSFDQGTVNGLVQDTIFRNYTRAGIVFYNNLHVDPQWSPQCSGTYANDASDQLNNTFDGSESAGTRCHFTRSHWNASLVCE